MIVRSDGGLGCYLYGIAPADQKLPAELTGLDGQAVGVVPYGGVAAVISPLDVERALARRADLLAHSRVLDAVAAVGPVIPVRFGSILQDRSAVLAQVLEPSHDRFEEMLQELAGYSQFTLRVRYDEQQVLSEVVAENPEIARLRAQTRDQPEDSSYAGRMRLGELVAAAMEAKRFDDGQTVLAAIEHFAADLRVQESSGLDQLIDVAVLVEDRQRAAFENAAEQLAAGLAGRARVKLVGPSAAYDFVDAEE
jgi:hypothetical protein